MSAVDATVAGRALAESVMQDACTLTRAGGPDVLNETTLHYAPAAPVVLYTGRCRVSGQGQYAAPVGSGGERVVYEQSHTVSLPIAFEDVRVDDVVTVTASATDPSQVGRVLRVRSVERKTFATARRLQCEEVTA